MKTCQKCKNELPHSEFHKAQKTRDRLRKWCKKCTNKYHTEWSAKKRAKLKEELGEEAFRRQQRDAYFRWQYGIGHDEYDNMLREQAGVCKACGLEVAGRLHVDHCHDSGLVRALLCAPCNQSLGLLREDPELIQRLKIYAETFCTKD